MPPVDASRYRLDPPSAAHKADPAAWKSAVDNAHSQLEHQGLRILNLELLLKYGPNSWRAQNQGLDALGKRLEQQLEVRAGPVSLHPTSRPGGDTAPVATFVVTSRLFNLSWFRWATPGTVLSCCTIFWRVGLGVTWPVRQFARQRECFCSAPSFLHSLEPP